MEAGKAGRMHVHVQPRSEFICHSCSLSRDCQEMNHSASRTFVECSEQPGKSYNHPVVTPSRPAVGPTWKGPHAHTDCLAVRSPSPVVSAFLVCQSPSPAIPLHSPLTAFSLRFARLAVLCLLVVAAGFLRADRASAQSACAQLGVDCNLPAPPPVPPPTYYGPSTGAIRAPPRAAIRLRPARVQHSTHQHSTHPRSPEQRDPPE